MAHRKAKPAPRGRARASGDVVAGQRNGQENVRPRIKSQAGEIVCYDGRNCTGWLIPKGGGWLAYSSTGRFIGSFASDRIGASAIYQAHRPGGER